MKDEELKQYEPPHVEIVEFALEDSIASSSDYGSDAICSETLWGDSE